MMRLAIASLRSRTSAFVAYFLSVFLGALVTGAFATLLESAAGDVSGKDRTTLITMGAVVGGWGLVIVLFSVASTLTLTVRQRGGELALLRTVGATPRQNRRMLLVESLAVTAVATLLAAVPAWLTGWALFVQLQHAGMLADTAARSTGGRAIAATSAAMVLVSSLAVVLATRRAARISVREAQSESATGPRRMGRWRVAAGLLFLAAGLNYSLITVTVMADSADPLAPMSTAGPACVFWSIGLALFAPLLLRVAAGTAALVFSLFGAAGHLAAHDSRARSHLLAAVLAPVIIFVGMSTGTIYLLAIENQATVTMTDEGRNVELLNYVVVGMISVFAAIMVVNTLAAVVSARRREFGQQRLAGATPEQVRTTMLLEGALVAVTGIIWGGLASLGTVLPYSWV
jgi:putative ABC transport system permease protein